MLNLKLLAQMTALQMVDALKTRDATATTVSLEPPATQRVETEDFQMETLIQTPTQTPALTPTQIPILTLIPLPPPIVRPSSSAQETETVIKMDSATKGNVIALLVSQEPTAVLALAQEMGTVMEEDSAIEESAIAHLGTPETTAAREPVQITAMVKGLAQMDSVHATVDTAELIAA